MKNEEVEANVCWKDGDNVCGDGEPAVQNGSRPEHLPDGLLALYCAATDNDAAEQLALRLQLARVILQLLTGRGRRIVADSAVMLVDGHGWMSTVARIGEEARSGRRRVGNYDYSLRGLFAGC